jgi:hypothetical protein
MVRASPLAKHVRWILCGIEKHWNGYHRNAHHSAWGKCVSLVQRERARNGSHGIPDIKEPAITAMVGTPIVDGDWSAMAAMSTEGYTLCL